jgi:hypothetical protein
VSNLGGGVSACEVRLIEGQDRVLARGVVAIDLAEGPPPVIAWGGHVYLLIADSAVYRKARVFYAGDSFEAVA